MKAKIKLHFEDRLPNDGELYHMKEGGFYICGSRNENEKLGWPGTDIKTVTTSLIVKDDTLDQLILEEKFKNNDIVNIEITDTMTERQRYLFEKRTGHIDFEAYIQELRDNRNSGYQILDSDNLLWESGFALWCIENFEFENGKTGVYIQI